VKRNAVIRHIHPVTKAVIAATWDAGRVDAEIHAFMGDDSDKLVNAAGKRFFVILGAVIAQGLHHDDPDIRIIRGAVNAVYDQAGEASIQADRRASITSGLQAVVRLQDRIELRYITAAAVDLARKLFSGDVRMSDFQKITERRAA
jgi:hypothetical protein